MLPKNLFVVVMYRAQLLLMQVGFFYMSQSTFLTRPYFFYIKQENLNASDLPIDSPSKKMLGFMRKYFRLEIPIRQSNSYVVFPAFFRNVNAFLVPRNRRTRTPVKPSPCSPIAIDACGDSIPALHGRCASVSRLTTPVDASNEPLASSPDPMPPARHASLTRIPTPGKTPETPDVQSIRPSVSPTPILSQEAERPVVRHHTPQIRSPSDMFAPRPGLSSRYANRIG